MNTPAIEAWPTGNNAADSKLPAVLSQARAREEARPRILYVDDEPQLRKLVELVLARSGYEVNTAADGAEGWEALQHSHYNLLMTDHDMPSLTGLQLATKARQAAMRLPILLTSGSADLNLDPSWGTLEFVTFLPKPFAVDVLLETVARALLTTEKLRPDQGAQPALARGFTLGIGFRQPCPHGGINE